MRAGRSRELRGRILAALRSIGQLRAFRAAIEVPTPRDASVSFWHRAAAEGGLLQNPGVGALDLLVSLLGEMHVSAYSDDARGGIAAEAVVQLTTSSGACGELLLSRLRPLGTVLELQGDEGVARVDLSGLGEWTGLEAGGATIKEALRLRRPLIHPWEAVGQAGDFDRLTGRTVLVTGATGFIGSRLVESLAASGAIVTACVRNPARAARITRFPVRIHAADLAEPHQASAAVAGQEVVFNLAHDLSRSAGRNFQTYSVLAEAAARAGVRRFVQTSSIAVYDGWPHGDLREDSSRDRSAYEYKDLKRAIEKDLVGRAAQGQFTAAILQPTIVYGPFSGLWTDQYARWLSIGDVALPEGGRGLCNGVYVDDLVQALVLAGGADVAGAESYIISGPRPFAWRELLEGYAAALPGTIVYEPLSVSNPVAEPGSAARSLLAFMGSLSRRSPFREMIGVLRDRLGPERLARLRQRLEGGVGSVRRPADAEPHLYLAQGVCSIEKAKTELGYRPRFPLSTGLDLTVAYLRWRFERREASPDGRLGGSGAKQANLGRSRPQKSSSSLAEGQSR